MKLFFFISLLQFVPFGFTIPLDKSSVGSVDFPTDIQYLLPNHTLPHHYDIKLNLTIGPDYYYDGFVSINLTTLEKTKTITLNIDKENITEVYLIHGKNIISVTNYEINLDNTFLTLNLIKEIQPGHYVLKIKFKALYYDQAGLMLSWYDTKTGKKPLLSTHFQPVYARRMLPCFDEPKLKATFQMEIIHPKSFNAASNTEIKSIESIGDYIITRFKKTPPMSTYLLVLSVSEEYRSYETKLQNTKFHVLVPRDNLNSSIFALNMTRDSVNAFQELLKVNYSLSKLDSVVVPSTGGGMENWGLIVYGPMILNVETEESLQSAAELIAHEVAHQWFGNLVTCDWWDYTWLNEGFATHYAPLIADAVLGNNSTRRFMYDHVARMQYVLKEDSLNDTKSLNFHVEHPYMVWSKFSNIGYQKGSAIVRFMSIMIPNFDNGITKYLQKYSFATAKPTQLFEILNEKAYMPFGTNVSAIMKNWVENPGYPLLTINITRHGQKATILFKQERFFIDPNMTATTNEKWWIPITLAFGGYPNFEKVHVFDWMRDSDESIVMYLEDLESNWVLGNVQAAVFCRVNYDLDNWNKIIKFLKSPDYQKIHVLNRARLIDDADNLVKAQKLPQKTLLDLLSYLKQEQDPIVKRLGKSVLVTYAELLKNTKIYSKYAKFVNEIFDEDILREPNFENIVQKIIKTPDNSGVAPQKFVDITSRMFNDNNYQKIKYVIDTLDISDPSFKRTQFVAELDRSYEINQIIKNNFWKGENYNEISDWLNEKY